ncbi:MAG: DMT family transporter [Gammaproteobacteria bacterium]
MSAGQQQNARGIFLVVLAMSVFAVQDVLIKFLSTDVSLFQILFFRSTLGILLIVMFQRATGKGIKLWTAYPFLSITRGILFFIGYSAFYFTQSKIPIANATVLFLVSPFFITMMSIYIFGSSVGLRRWFAMLIGFSGVVIIAQPEAGEFDWLYLLPVGVAFAYAISMMIAKTTAEKDTVYQQIIVMYIVTATLAGITGILFGDGSIADWGISGIEFVSHPWRMDILSINLYLLAVAVVGTSAFILLTGGYRIADPAVISPYEYSGLAAVLILGFIVFGEVPSAHDGVGMLLIVGSGIYLFYRERIQGQDNAAEATLR